MAKKNKLENGKWTQRGEGGGGDVQIGVVNLKNRVVLHLSKTVGAVGLDEAQANALGDLLKQRAAEIRDQ